MDFTAIPSSTTSASRLPLTNQVSVFSAGHPLYSNQTRPVLHTKLSGAVTLEKLRSRLRMCRTSAGCSSVTNRSTNSHKRSPKVAQSSGHVITGATRGPQSNHHKAAISRNKAAHVCDLSPVILEQQSHRKPGSHMCCRCMQAKTPVCSSIGICHTTLRARMRRRNTTW